MDKNFELVDCMMDGILQTEEWRRISMNDPQIVAGQAQLNALMDKLAERVPRKMMMDLEEAINQASIAGWDAAVLYGIHVGLAVRKIAADPMGYSAARLEAAAEQRRREQHG